MKIEIVTAVNMSIWSSGVGSEFISSDYGAQPAGSTFSVIPGISWVHHIWIRFWNKIFEKAKYV